METRKTFLAFLTLASVSVFVLVAPILNVVWRHAMDALNVSLQSEAVHNYWWARWYSWVLVGGPLGRWPVGIGFGYRLLAMRDAPYSDWHMGSIVNGPSLTLFLIIQIALALALFTAVSFCRRHLSHTHNTKFR
jgi:palmitoyltransferase